MADKKQRVGFGYDVHPFAPERKLMLGGVEVKFDKGLAGWSDADALIHAIIEALLGAASLGDIGQHFPPGDPKYLNVSSIKLLAKVSDELFEKGWHIINVDATIVTEAPKLADYIGLMKLRISRTLGINMSQVSVKSKTSGGLGFVGRSEGIAAYAVALIESK